MYEPHWKFQVRPFDDTADERFFYSAPTHSEGLARLVYLVSQHRSGGCLIGPHGIGKTLLLRVAARACDERSAVVQLSAGPGDALTLVRRISERLGISPETEDVPSALRNIERACRHDLAQNVLIVIDDAQLLRDPAALDALSFIAATMEAEGHCPTLLLAGTDELAANLPPAGAIGQRLQLTWQLTPFSLAETAAYVRHRLTVAGRHEEIFDQASLYLLHEHSAGIPRLINQLADLALLLGSLCNAPRIDHGLMTRAIGERRAPARAPDAGNKETPAAPAGEAGSKLETAAELYVWE